MKTIYYSIVRSVSVLFLLCFLNAGFATTYYISTTGNDVTGNGTLANPWRTLFKATSTVSGARDIIHINAGTYVERQQAVLAVGVSIEGDGVTSIIQSTLTALYTPMIILQSVQGTSGNQSISNIKIDGRMTTHWGLLVNGRSNVIIHDITMVDCFDRGLIFTGAFNIPLSIYATGNQLYNSVITNCGQNNGTGYGCLMIGGQDGLLIHHNTISQTSRAEGLNGWPIKYMDEGHLKNMKMYNNTFNKNMQTGLSAYVDWPFVMELFNMEGGNEIYNNNCIGGGIDIVFMTKGTSTYSVWIHDNNISCPTLPVASQSGVTCENLEPPEPADIRDIIIERNTFTNLSVGVYFTPRVNGIVENITIQNNLMVNHSGIGQSGAFINMGEECYTAQFYNVNILNNTFIANPSAPFYTGILLPSGSTSGGVISGINIKNNNMSGGSAASVFCQNNTIPIRNLNISNNNFYNNSADTDFRNGQSLPGYVFASNSHVNPTYASNYTLPSGSALIDAGTYVGLPYLGAAPDKGYAETNIALPVKLINFRAEENFGKNILQWKTASENNSDYFSIERSSNGLNFTAIGRVNATGFSSNEMNYNFIDVTPLFGINYYRLAMVDKDNSSEYSNIISISHKTELGMNILSAKLSSGKKEVSMSIYSTQKQKISLTIFDHSGRIFLNEVSIFQIGINNITKSAVFAARGIYYIKIMGADETQVKKVFTSD